MGLTLFLITPSCKDHGHEYKPSKRYTQSGTYRAGRMKLRMVLYSQSIGQLAGCVAEKKFRIRPEICDISRTQKLSESLD